MYQRIAYPESAINGLSPCITDPDGPAARDITAIIKELSEIEIGDKLFCCFEIDNEIDDEIGDELLCCFENFIFSIYHRKVCT